VFGSFFTKALANTFSDLKTMFKYVTRNELAGYLAEDAALLSGGKVERRNCMTGGEILELTRLSIIAETLTE